MEGVEVVKDGKSFFWSGRYHMDMNTRDTLVTELNVLGQFNPQLPDSFQDCEFLMLGNLAPAVQISVINQLKNRPKLIIMDTMNFGRFFSWLITPVSYTHLDVYKRQMS